jgi:hypothetical protein
MDNQEKPSEEEVVAMLRLLKNRHKWQMIYAISVSVLQFVITFAAGVVVGKHF